MLQKILILFAFLITSNLNIHAAKHTVTNGNNSGVGSLRQAVDNANPNDTIIIHFCVDTIKLNSAISGITYYKNLTIIGREYGVWGSKTIIQAPINAVTRQKDPIFSIGNATLKTHNLIFDGAAADHQDGVFIAINCTFRNDNPNYFSVCTHEYFVAINCTFIDIDEPIRAVDMPHAIYLYHCTFDENQAIGISGTGYIYAYNCIITGIQNITGGNYLHIANGVLDRDLVFGTNVYKKGYVVPLDYAKTATRLTTNSIQVPPTGVITAAEVLNYLAYDQIGNLRSTTGNVAYGSVERDNIVIPPTPFTVTVNVNNTQYGTATRSNLNCWNLKRIQATPRTNCHRFVNWTDIYGKVISLKQTDTIDFTSDSVLIANFILIEINLMLEANPNTVGTVTGAGRYDCNKPTIIEATVIDTCYTFLNWQDRNGKIISTKARDTIAFNRDTVLVANFVLRTFNLQITTNPSNPLLVTEGAGRYNCNTNAVIKAYTDSPCYRFLHWFNNTTQEIISTKRVDTIFMNKNISLVAVYIDDITFNIDLQVMPPNAGKTTGSGVYKCDETATIAAEPIDSCYYFHSWRNKDNADDIISMNQQTTITLISDTSLVAYFVLRTFELRTTTFPASPEFTALGTGRYNCQTEAIIEAYTVAYCYRFSHWVNAVTQEIVSTKQVDTIFIDKNTYLVAIFVPDKTYTVGLQVNPPEAGTVAGAGVYKCEDKVSISTTPEVCYIFVNWTDTLGNIISANAHHEFSIIRDMPLIANYQKVNFHNVKLSANPTAGGTVSGMGIYLCPDDVADINAKSNTNYRFVYWRDKSNGNVFSTIANTSFEVNREFDLEAMFVYDTADVYLVDLRSEPQSAGILTGTGIYYLDEKVVIKAVANAGFYFEHWRDSQENIISTTANFELTVKSDTTLFAVFQKIEQGYSVTITISPNYMGKLDGATTGVYPYNYSDTVKATPSDNYYKFIRWTNSSGVTLTTDPTLNFTIKSDTHFVAHFELDISVEERTKTTTISIIPNPTKDDFEISFEVQKPSNIEIKLLDLSGAEVFEIFSDFTNEGIFSKTVNTKNLARGVYFLYILIDESVIMEKVVLE